MLGKVFWKKIQRQVYTFKSEMVRLDIHTIIDKSKYIVHVTMFDRFKKTIFKFLILVNNAKPQWVSFTCKLLIKTQCVNI